MIAHIDQENSREESVQTHLEEVSRIAFKLAEPLNIGYLARLAGLLHDLGKWRKRFEQYLRDAVSGSQKARKGKVNHSSAGAIYIYRKYYDGGHIQRLTAQMIAVAILSHHGLNDCLDIYGADQFHRRIESLEGLDYEEVMENLKHSSISESMIEEYFQSAMKEVAVLESRIKADMRKRNLHPEYTIAMISRMLLSVLIDADRLATAQFCGDRIHVAYQENDKQIWTGLCDRIEQYLAGFKMDDFVSGIRKQVSEECLQFAVRKPGVYRLAVPTGGAKTLSSLRYALHHAGKYKKDRIFYIGPYLSIVEQNSQVFREALGDGDFILEHHSNVVTEEGQNQAESRQEYNRYKLLTENWESPLVITTFVQFLNTLFSDSTQSVRRFHSLSNAVIIIDEIQSLPITMISMFNLAINYFSSLCGTTVILCSATQPILDEVPVPVCLNEPKDMIKNQVSLYQQLKRVRIEVKEGMLDTGRLSDFIISIMDKHRNALLIVNTKTAAKKIFCALRDYYRTVDEEIRLIHLSTNMCAQHRLEYIRYMKEKLKTDKILCISTNLIEAGVDLSFSCVIRSFAGLDSIAQAAGRCNRNGEEKEGVVYLIEYKEERLGYLEQIEMGGKCSQSIVEAYQRRPDYYQHDLLSPKALHAFYKKYYHDDKQKQLMAYPVPEKGICLLDLLAKNAKGQKAAVSENRTPDLEMFQAFKTAGKNFKVIDNNTTAVIVPYQGGQDIILNLTGSAGKRIGPELRTELRKAQRYTVNLYKNNIDQLHQSGAVTYLEEIGVHVLQDGFYDEDLGVIYDGMMNFLEV